MAGEVRYDGLEPFGHSVFHKSVRPCSLGPDRDGELETEPIDPCGRTGARRWRRIGQGGLSHGGKIRHWRDCRHGEPREPARANQSHQLFANRHSTFTVCHAVFTAVLCALVGP